MAAVESLTTIAPPIAGAVARPATMAAVTSVDAVGRVSRWLLLAVGLDLVVTRLIVRLSIFVPKGEPWASLSAGFGRIGAVADVLVPIVGIILLVLLLARAGRAALIDRLLALGVALVAAFGFALVWLPPDPAIVSILETVIALVAVGAGLRASTRGHLPTTAAGGVVLLAGSIALAAAARALASASFLQAGNGIEGAALAQPVLWLEAAGQFGYVAGGALVGLAGLLTGLRAYRDGVGIATADSADPGRSFLVACAVGLVIAVFTSITASASPLYWGALAIWSLGLSGVIPAPAIGVAAGLAVAGLPSLGRSLPAVAIGSGIILLSGYALAASGLVLAALLGLLVISSEAPRRGTEGQP